MAKVEELNKSMAPAYKLADQVHSMFQRRKGNLPK
jgi:hypothetical protein